MVVDAVEGMIRLHYCVVVAVGMVGVESILKSKVPQEWAKPMQRIVLEVGIFE